MVITLVVVIVQMVITFVLVVGFLIALRMVLRTKAKVVKVKAWFTKWGGVTLEVQNQTPGTGPGRNTGDWSSRSRARA